MITKIINIETTARPHPESSLRIRRNNLTAKNRKGTEQDSQRMEGACFG
jgi:hypothetical protein